MTRDDPSEPVDRGKDVVRENRRSKVFRHHLKRIDDKVYTDSNRLSLLTSRRTEALTSDLTPEEALSPSLYSHSNPPLSLAMKGFEKAESKYNSLPPDYKAPVSTLPPIGGFVNIFLFSAFLRIQISYFRFVVVEINHYYSRYFI